MLVAVREYASASEMLSNLMAIRRGFMTYARTEIPEVIKPEPLPAQPSGGGLRCDCAHRVWWWRIPPAPVRAIANDNEADIWPHRLTVTDVLKAVSRVWKVPVRDIINARRTANVMRPRFAAYALACRLTPCSLPHIGRIMGGRDHASVLNGRNKMRPKIEAVEARIGPNATAREWAQEMLKEIGHGATPGPRRKVQRDTEVRGCPAGDTPADLPAPGS